MESFLTGIKPLYSSKFVEPTEDENTIWCKNTLVYYSENIDKIRNMVWCMAKDLSASDIDTIVSKVCEYFENGKDYGDVESEEDNFLTLEQYINRSVGFCVKRFRHDRSKELANRVSNVACIEDDEEKSIFDMISDVSVDDAFDTIGYDLSGALKQLQYKRFWFGMDIFNLMYIQLSSLLHHVNSEPLLAALNLTKKDMANAYKKALCDSDFMYLLKNFSLKLNESSDGREVIAEVGKYVYGRARLEEAIENACKCA